MTPTQREKFIELLKEEILSLNEEKMNEYTFVLDNLDKFQWFFDKMFTKHNEPINRSYRLATGVLSDAPHFEKVLRGVTRSRYLKVLRGTLPHKAYRRENILFGILASTKDGNRINKIVNPNPSFTDKSLRNHVHRMYHKKYTPIITNEMDRIKKKA
ncbi:MAG: hypothetical protein IE909_18010, partial [Campylobacterales bacterium]|nr:hypothetical protein [Campylobacterales bacterium]